MENLFKEMQYHYGPQHWPETFTSQTPEWSVQNGAGGYAGSTFMMTPTRRHHGLLVASLTAPIQRQMVWTRCEEQLVRWGGNRPVWSQRLDGVLYDDDTPAVSNRTTQQEFRWGGTPLWTYTHDGVTVTRQLCMARERNLTALVYALENQSIAEPLLWLTPRFCWRGAGDAGTPEAMEFTAEYLPESGQAILTPKAAPEWKIRVRAVGGEIQPLEQPEVSGPIYLRTEDETGDPRPERDVGLFRIRARAHRGQKTMVVVTCSLEKAEGFDPAALPTDGRVLLTRELMRQTMLQKQAGATDVTTARLVQSADQFLVRRDSTDGMTMLAGLPWFTDWGRDTMIAFEGNCLCTRRFRDARSILSTFAQYEDKGLVPNMFPDAGSAPLYNTVDGSMWYVSAVGMYLQYTGQPEDYDYVREKLWPCIRNILTYYEKGTDFSIGMDPADSLVHAGGGVDQVTWMDIRVGDWVPTPRHGKPVEINALWYNALCIGEMLARRFGEEENAAHWADLAAQVQANYAKAYWVENEKGGYLCDVVEYDGRQDDSLRPNQLMAVSLRRCLPAGKPPLLTPQQEQSVVKVCEEYLWAGPGMRTLPTDHKDYHGRYIGKLADRDAAYHQGTAWGWPLGEFLMAYHQAFAADPDTPAALRRLVQPALDALYTGGVNCMAEIFDADAPHNNRGCFNQAWSIGTVLAAWRSLPGLETAEGNTAKQPL